MKLSDFNLLDDDKEKESLNAIIQGFNQTKTNYPREKTVHALFAEQAAKIPDAIAIIHGEESMSYRELERQSNQLARFLIDKGLESESFVGVMCERSLDMVVVILGIMKAGGAYLPINHELPFNRIKYMLEETHTRFLISESQYRDEPFHLQNECVDLEFLLCLNSVEVSNAHRNKHQFDQWVLGAYSDAPVEEHSRPDALAYLIYTSGTAGQPKGVMVEHRSIVRLVVNTDYIQIGESDRILQTGALAFDASTFEIWGALLNGGAVCFPDEEELLNAEKLNRLIQQHRITTIFLTTALFNQLVEEHIGIFNGLKTVLSGGEKVSVYHFNKLRGAYPTLTLLHVYGPTENTTFTTAYPVDKTFEQDIPIGKPIANTSVYILDNNLKPVSVGVIGELCTGGDGLARGYLNDPELTVEKFIQHPSETGEHLYRTGDLARWMPDGNIAFIGRRDEQVKVRGYRIEPAEIENALLQHKAVKLAVVVARNLDADSKELVAYLITDQEQLDINHLRDYLKNTLPDYMIPAYFVKLDQLPLTPNGKVDKKALPAPEMTHQFADDDPDLPKTETEKQLASIWEEVLGHQGIRAKDDFFDLGGHSLKATKLASLVSKKMGLEIPFTTIFKVSTLRDFSEYLLDIAKFGIKEVDEIMILLNGETSGNNIFAFPPGTGDAIGFAQVAELLKPYGFYAFNFVISETLIKDYADHITSIDAEGPYLLFGYSGGGNLAFHVAKELEERGKCVSDIIMVDSGQFKENFQFPEGEAQRIASQFLNDESVKPYITSPVLKDKFSRTVERYYAYISNTVDTHTINANIHLLIDEDSKDIHRDNTGRIIVSRQGWAEVTRGTFKTYQGTGGHNFLLSQPYVENNVRILREIVEQIFSRNH
jgi:amino acid adenylation domain-containing protein